MTAFGVVGWVMRRTGFPLAPVILGLVLGPLMEKSLRRAMALSAGDWRVLVDSPIAIVLWALAVASLVVPPLLARRTRLPVTEAAAAGETD
jgi:putative tricarboxylic transport membrane protein